MWENSPQMWAVPAGSSPYKKDIEEDFAVLTFLLTAWLIHLIAAALDSSTDSRISISRLPGRPLTLQESS